MSEGSPGARAAAHFSRLFGRQPALVADAPGRVNLIGEHTDYNGGFVLPMAIPQRTWAALGPARTSGCRVWSEEVAGPECRTFTLGEEAPHGDWLDYVKGVTHALRTEGYAIGAFDLALVSDVPLGSGLSSSAALEVSLLRGLRTLWSLDLDDVRLARLGQLAENEFVGAPVGLMDQMAASLADAQTALFLDTRTLRYERVALPGGADLAVVNSGVAHSHAAGDYRTRRAECERAAALLGAAQLRDLTVADLDRVMQLPEPLGRRARHVITENQRVLDAVAAMQAGDLERLGGLFYESHASQRDDYAVSVSAIDLLVELTWDEPLVYGARLTGGGFGGSIVMLVRAGHALDLANRVAAEYARRSGRAPSVLVPATAAS